MYSGRPLPFFEVRGHLYTGEVFISEKDQNDKNAIAVQLVRADLVPGLKWALTWAGIAF